MRRMAGLSSLQIFKSSLRTTSSLLRGVVQSSWHVLILLYLLEFAASQFFSYGEDYLQSTGREELLFIASLAFFEFIFTMLWSAVWLLAIASQARTQMTQTQAPQLSTSYATSFNQILIEEVRSLAAILWRTPLFLIPAGVEYFRLALVPFVVILSPGYQQGRVDALVESRRLARGHFWLLAITVLASAGLPMLIEKEFRGSGSSWIWENPFGVGLGCFGSFVIDILATLFLFSLYHTLSFSSETERT